MADIWYSLYNSFNFFVFENFYIRKNQLSCCKLAASKNQIYEKNRTHFPYSTRPLHPAPKRKKKGEKKKKKKKYL